MLYYTIIERLFLMTAIKSTTTLQIATFGLDNQQGILLALRSFPVHKLALVCYASDEQATEEFAKRIERVLDIPITIHLVDRNNTIRNTIKKVTEIVDNNANNFQQVLMNISSGTKMLTCAALSSAFIVGIPAFGMDESGALSPMPVLKLSYNEVITEPKVKILRAISSAGGIIESLEQLEEITGYAKPLLSYHINGGKNFKGLVNIGLLEVKRGGRGRSAVKLTALGEILLSSKAINSL